MNEQQTARIQAQAWGRFVIVDTFGHVVNCFDDRAQAEKICKSMFEKNVIDTQTLGE